MVYMKYKTYKKSKYSNLKLQTHKQINRCFCVFFFFLKHLGKLRLSINRFPSVKIVPTPRGSMLHPTRASKVPYNAHNQFY